MTMATPPTLSTAEPADSMCHGHTTYPSHLQLSSEFLGLVARARLGTVGNFEFYWGIRTLHLLFSSPSASLLVAIGPTRSQTMITPTNHWPGPRRDQERTSDLVIEAMPTVRGLDVGGIAVLPDPYNSDGWLVSERNGASGAIPDARLGDNTHDPTQRTVS